MKLLNKIIFLLLIFTTATSKAQEVFSSYANRIANAEFIFEGRVIQSTSYLVNDGKYINTSNTIEITKIFKGSLTCGTVEVITKGGDVGNWSVSSEHTLDLDEGAQGIFLCNNTDLELSTVDFYPETNFQKLEATFEDQSYVKYLDNGDELYASDMWYQFKDFIELYSVTDSIITYTDSTISSTFIECGAASLIYPSNIIHGELPYTQIMPNYNRTVYDEQIANSEYKKTMQKPKSGSRSSNNLTYSMSNPIITGTSPKYFEFDINLSQSDASKYFNNGLIRLSYDASTFGTNVVSNSKIQVTRGTVIADVITYAPPTPADMTPTEIAIPLTTSTPIPILNLFPLSNTPTYAVHVKIEMANCISTNVAFTSLFTMGILSFYGNTTNDTFGTSYDAITATSSLSVPPCKTTITSFTPTSVAGGTKQLLQIRGFQFGSTIGKVYFANADDGGISKVYTDVSDIAFGGWTDTLIQVYVPSYDSATISSIYQKYPAGTGKFIVQSNLTGIIKRDTSDIPIDIRYSVMNSKYKQPVYLAPLAKFNHKYTFRCDTSVANYKGGAMKNIIRRALKDWTCLTGIDWELGADTFGFSAPLFDSICVISFSTLGSTSTGFSQLALATNYTLPCSIARNFHLETDIEIDKTYNWFCDSIPTNPIPVGEKDFYFAILHELGHAHGLNHNINASSIMHFSYIPSPRKIELFYDNPADSGGTWVMNSSLSISIGSCTIADNIQTSSSPLCNIPNGIEQKFNTGKVNLYPNPTNAMLNIDITGFGEYETIKLSITNLAGNVVISKPIQVSDTKSLELDLTNLNTGMYFITLENKQQRITSKLIKL